MDNAQDGIDVVYLPYLPLRERALVGDWELIPQANLRTDDCLDERAEDLARGLAAVYVLPKRGGVHAGAFARQRDGRIGQAAREMRSIEDLRRACVVTVLDPNPSPLLPEGERDLNAGHWMLTTENAMVVAHGIIRAGGHTGTIMGSRLPFISLGVSVLDDPEGVGGSRGKVLPPADVRIPTFTPPRFDAEYANATWESIRRGDDAARRLGRAIDWLALADLNTSLMTHDVRIPSLRAGFEVLLNTGDFLELGHQLAKLVADDSEATERRWTNRSGTAVVEKLGDVAWWSVKFSFLRNALMHGDFLDQEQWRHDGVSHIDLGEWYMRQAIKHAVAKDGHASLLEPLLWRKALAAVVARNSQDAGSAAAEAQPPGSASPDDSP